MLAHQFRTLTHLLVVDTPSFGFLALDFGLLTCLLRLMKLLHQGDDRLLDDCPAVFIGELGRHLRDSAYLNKRLSVIFNLPHFYTAKNSRQHEKILKISLNLTIPPYSDLQSF